MGRRGNVWITVTALLAFLGAVAVGIFALMAGTGLVREYGPAEGYGNLALQVLPIVAVGLALAALLTWAGVRLTRRRRNGPGRES